MKNSGTIDSLSSLFVEPIQVSIGIRDNLSRIPESSEREDFFSPKLNRSAISVNMTSEFAGERIPFLYSRNTPVETSVSWHITRGKLFGVHCSEFVTDLPEHLPAVKSLCSRLYIFKRFNHDYQTFL